MRARKRRLHNWPAQTTFPPTTLLRAAAAPTFLTTTTTMRQSGTVLSGTICTELPGKTCTGLLHEEGRRSMILFQTCQLPQLHLQARTYQITVAPTLPQTTTRGPMIPVSILVAIPDLDGIWQRLNHRRMSTCIRAPHLDIQTLPTRIYKTRHGSRQGNRKLYLCTGYLRLPCNPACLGVWGVVPYCLAAVLALFTISSTSKVGLQIGACPMALQLWPITTFRTIRYRRPQLQRQCQKDLDFGRTLPHYFRYVKQLTLPVCLFVVTSLSLCFAQQEKKQ